MTDLDLKIKELNDFINESEKEVEYIKNEITKAKKSIKKLERIKAEIADIVL